MVRPSRRREMAKIAVCNERLSIRAACAAFTISETCYCYQAKLSDENPEIDNWLEVLYGRHRNWGFKLCFLYLHNVKGFGWNHKCVYRNYCELALNLLIKQKNVCTGRCKSRYRYRQRSMKCGPWTSSMISYLMSAVS